MRTLLIVFAILLVLLTLLGTFGGSIRYTEPFYEVANSAIVNAETSGKMSLPSKAPFFDQQPPPFPTTEPFYEPIPTTPGDVEESTKPKSSFTSMPPMPTLPTKMPFSNGPDNFVQEGFMIEPFEEDNKASFPAAY